MPQLNSKPRISRQPAVWFLCLLGWLITAGCGISDRDDRLTSPDRVAINTPTPVPRVTPISSPSSIPPISSTVLPSSDLEEVASTSNVYKRYSNPRGFRLIHPSDWFVAEIGEETIVSADLPNGVPSGDQISAPTIRITTILKPAQLDQLMLHDNLLNRLREEAGRTAFQVSQEPFVIPDQGGDDQSLSAARSEAQYIVADAQVRLVLKTIEADNEIIILTAFIPELDGEAGRFLIDSVLDSVEVAPGSGQPDLFAGRDAVSDAVTAGRDDVLSERYAQLKIEGVISPGQTTSGAVIDFEANGWRLLGKAGERYDIEIIPKTDRFEPIFNLLDANGRSILAGQRPISGKREDREESAQILIPADGNYTLIVEGANFAGGLYDIMVRRIDQLRPSFEPSGSLIAHQTVTGTLAAGEIAYWLSAAHSNQPLDIDIISDNASTFSLQTVDLNGDQAPSQNELIPTNLNGYLPMRYFQVIETQMIGIEIINRSRESQPYQLRLSLPAENRTFTLLPIVTEADQTSPPLEFEAGAGAHFEWGLFGTGEAKITLHRDQETILERTISNGWSEIEQRLTVAGDHSVRWSIQNPDGELRGYLIGNEEVVPRVDIGQAVWLGIFDPLQRQLSLDLSTLDSPYRLLIDPLNPEMDVSIQLLNEAGAPILTVDEAFRGASENIVIERTQIPGFSGKIEVSALPGESGFVRLNIQVVE